MTEREKEVIEIIKKYPEEIFEVVLDLFKKRYKIATKRDIRILYYRIKLKIAQSESNTKLEIEKLRAETNERINQLENNTKLEIEKLRIEFNERITQLENNTKLEIEKLKAESNERITQLENNTKLEIEIEKIRAETQYHIAKSESRIIKFILASSIIQTIFIISAVLAIVFAKCHRLECWMGKIMVLNN